MGFQHVKGCHIWIPHAKVLTAQALLKDDLKPTV